MEQLITIAQLSDFLQVKKSWLYERTRTRQIPFHRVGKYVRFDVKEVELWLSKANNRSLKISGNVGHRKD